MVDVKEKTSSLVSHGIAVIKQVVKTLPETPGVYRMLDEHNTPLYVGKAKSLKRRVASYTNVNKLSNRLQRMVAYTKSMEIVTTHTETEALLLESNLIKKFKPRYNVLLKDDKSFPYILITKNHPYPRLMKHRGKQSIKGKYFGPFASISAVDETIISLTKTFQLRTCSDSFFAARERACLQYHIKRCSGPCVEHIDNKEYTELTNQAADFLAGKDSSIQKNLATKMQQASDQMDYEKAAIYRDRIKQLTNIQSRQNINVASINNADIIAVAQAANLTCIQVFFFRGGKNFGTESFFLTQPGDISCEESISAFLTQFYNEHKPAPKLYLSHMPIDSELITKALTSLHKLSSLNIEAPKVGIKKDLVQHALVNAENALQRKLNESASYKKLIDEVAKVFNMSEPPQRIEVYDNSHIQGANPYGVMIVANQNGLDKKSYRKFAIKNKQPEQGGDDYDMMREVIERRLKHASEENWALPELMLIDGGKGQLNAVLEVIGRLGVEGIKVVGIAKGLDRNAGRERFFMEKQAPFSLPENDSCLHFLQRLRDEAHNFAIGTHRASRKKKLVHSQLDDIPGIGSKRKKLLLQHFGSAKSVQQAGLKDLQSVPGINKSVAIGIYEYFHK